MTAKPDPIRPTDDQARALARDLLASARSAALAVILPEGGPMVTRVAFGLSPERAPLTLISSLAAHTTALQANPAASLLVGEPGAKGDPLTHPRLTLLAQASFIAHDHPDYEKMAAHYLRDHPKAKLYIGFADFSFARFSVSQGLLNGGFGRAFRLTPADMGLPV
ncbi:MAG: HugZ family protein [Pseudodonghicola sp.]|uniref:HugZ family pyridoxamine 5'-phosphate oxidase n=1 Tax=Pseudodonghicola sp. TaxID=1969463 RepID=UPI003A971D2D